MRFFGSSHHAKQIGEIDKARVKSVNGAQGGQTFRDMIAVGFRPSIKPETGKGGKVLGFGFSDFVHGVRVDEYFGESEGGLCGP